MQKIITMMIGGYSLVEIAKELEFTPPRINQLKNKAVETLRNFL